MIVAMALGLALLIQAFVIKPYQIPSGSMEPTLDIGQRVLVNRFIFHFTDPKPGDIVVFHPPKGVEGTPFDGCAVDPGNGPCPQATPDKASDTFIKRIVAGPGDTVSIKDGYPIVNGVWENNPSYSVRPCGTGGRNCDMPGKITIPADHFFMMGDNRGNSEDSRFWGPLPDKWLIGKAFATYWPPNRIGGL